MSEEFIRPVPHPKATLLDDQDEFSRFQFDDFAVSLLRDIRTGTVNRLSKKDFGLATQEQMERWVHDIDLELSHRGICNKCWRMACTCDEGRTHDSA